MTVSSHILLWLKPLLVFALLVLAGLIEPAPSAAQAGPTISWGGEVRPRLYGREPIFGQWDHWISMRTRVNLEVTFESGIGLYFQLQDVRLWGEEFGTRDPAADQLDFHQAYLAVDSVPGIGGTVRLGRQEVDVGESRLIAQPNWGHGGQSFDGVRLLRPVGEASLDLLYFRLQEGSSPNHDNSADVVAVAFYSPEGDLGAFDFLVIHDRTGEPAETHRTTVGPKWRKRSGNLSFRAQGMIQVGEDAGQNFSSHMLALRSTLHLLGDRAGLTLWYDQLSGDSDLSDGTSGSFSTLFGARHRYYGRSDYFRNIPEDTGGLGLRDLALKLEYHPNDFLSMYLDLHSFRTDEIGALSSQNLAEEVDLWLEYRFRDRLDIEVGYSLTRAGTAMRELGRLEGTGNMVYLMTSVAF